ncbi:PAS domain-containing protein [Microvirga sp. 2MCAF38]|uniref:PAS domain-containing protein n=1 Tax=Microvirga sp. 2MCAF38 TaxID=3232989 RepID=UPI003F976B0C
MTGSAAFRKSLGLSDDVALTYTKFQESYHPEDAQRVKNSIEEAIASSSDYDIACRIIRADGSIGYVAMKGCAIYAGGRPIRLIGTFRTLSEEDQAGRGDVAQHRLKFVLDLMDQIRKLDDPLAIVDSAIQELGTFLKADRAGCGEASRSGEVANREWVNTTAETASRSYNLDSVGADILSELRGGQTVLVTDSARDTRLEPDAKVHYAARLARSTIIVPLNKRDHLSGAFYISAGRPYAFSVEDAALAGDVAKRVWSAVERAQTESDLRESEARLHIVAETLPALVWIVTPELELIYANARWSRYSGLAENESLGLSWMGAVHPDDLAKIMEDFQEILRGQLAYATEARYRNRDGVYRWHMIRAEPIHDARGAFRGWSGTSVDIHDLKQTEEALRKNDTQLRIALQAARMGVWSWDRATDAVDLSPEAAELSGVDPASKFTWKQLQTKLTPADAARAIAARAHALETGEPYSIEYRVMRNDKQSDKIWIVAQGQTTYNSNGVATGMTGVVQDITDRKIAEERQNLLIRELHHRVKNTLATVQAIVGSTARTASSIEEFYQGFVGRIVSLARTHNLLTDDLWQKASLGDLIQTELGPYDDDNRNRIVIEGPTVELPSEAAVPIGMAIHELTTNAAKHGALSTFGGQIDARWHIEQNGGKPFLHFSWTELGGPKVARPSHQGFGSRLLQRVLTTQLQADVHMDFGQDGLHFTMVMPVPGEPPLFNPDQ